MKPAPVKSQLRASRTISGMLHIVRKRKTRRFLCCYLKSKRTTSSRVCPLNSLTPALFFCPRDRWRPRPNKRQRGTAMWQSKLQIVPCQRYWQLHVAERFDPKTRKTPDKI